MREVDDEEEGRLESEMECTDVCLKKIAESFIFGVSGSCRLLLGARERKEFEKEKGNV